MATPKSSITRDQPRRLVKAARSKTALVTSKASAERAKAQLRRGRNRLQTEPTVDETSVRSSLL